MKRRRGFTLMLLMVVLLLLGTFALLASRLFTSAMRTTQAAQDSQTRWARFDNMLASLRADAWGAKAIETPDATTARLSQPDGATVVWRIAADGSVTRAIEGGDAAGRRAWPALGATLSFARRDAALVLAVGEGRGGQADELLLPSQVLAANGSQP